MRQTIIAALLSGALLTACGGDDSAMTTAGPSRPGTDAAKPTTTIRIVDFVYDPTPATVQAGQRISIPNADAAPHTITDAGSGKAFDSGTVEGKATGSVTFAKAGTYSYVCEFHPFMKGEVTVAP